MSFKCDNCHKPQPDHTKPFRVVVETRKKVYPERRAADGKTVIDNGGEGYEIVKEMNLCISCYEERNK